MREKQMIIQGTYFLMWFIFSIGIVGNIERGCKTNIILIVIYAILCVLVAGKFLYWIRKGEI